MDLISHGVLGFVLAGLGVKEKLGAASVAGLVLASMAPDFDGVVMLKGARAFYKYHREITHSLVGATAIGLVLAAGLSFLFPLTFFQGLGVSALGMALHLLMDSLTPWGVPLFYPFSSKKYSFNLVWFFDPVVIGSLLGALMVGYEVPHLKFSLQLSALGVIGFYLLLRVHQKRRSRLLAARELPAYYRRGKMWVLPSAVSPFQWDVIACRSSRYYYMKVDSLRERVVIRREYASASYHRCVACSQESELVEIFLKRARFPIYNVLKEENAYIIEWLDVHLLQIGGLHGVRVAVDNTTGAILEEKLQVKKPPLRIGSRVILRRESA
ncbi:MAG: inner membrane protein [Eubacteriales bacterium]|nr:inner membrane protein [Eubacteriales bacterium]MDN5363219.1 inner membrane protein [Eubacteriales bacterium]